MENRFNFRIWKQNCWGYNIKYEIVRKKPHYEYIKLNTNNLSLVKTDIIEQCTGLKDKNGNLIYEGDILEIKWNNDDYPRYYEVNFEDGAFGIKPLECNDWLDSEYISDISQDTLIIGNIHENKDLLEGKYGL